ncbi:hypothetical protein C4565_00615 [Candidatus Parcubacteria bacterium]|nr:MAG: hypothetical protein C4565_00615 [Candidatus Parcubacteria bacterium]
MFIYSDEELASGKYKTVGEMVTPYLLHEGNKVFKGTQEWDKLYPDWVNGKLKQTSMIYKLSE